MFVFLPLCISHTSEIISISFSNKAQEASPECLVRSLISSSLISSRTKRLTELTSSNVDNRITNESTEQTSSANEDENIFTAKSSTSDERADLEWSFRQQF